MDVNFQRLYDLEFLGLTEDDLANYSPTPIKWFTQNEDPAITLLRMMRDPAHFHFTCKHLLNIDLGLFQLVLLQEMWKHPFPMLVGTRGMSKSYLLALYSLLRATFVPGSKIIVTGMGFRQAKQILNYGFKFWDDAPLLQSMFSGCEGAGKHPGNDRIWLQLGDSSITGVPIGDGNSIRGLRANIVIADEFATIAREIFETVIVGFGAVSLNPMLKVRNKAKIRVLERLKLWTEEMAERERQSGMANQLIISGTCYYQFNHLYTYWKRWKQIIESRGDERKLKEAFLGQEMPKKLNWKHYAIFRIPIELIPEGFMDEDQIARSQATMHSSTYQNEYQAVFGVDSNGFFNRRLIETCVTNEPIVPFDSTDPVQFRVVLRGDPSCDYVFGIDPASENDNLSIVILEVHPTHRRVVYCWTTTRQEFKQRMGGASTNDTEFYGFVAAKIRDLMRLFPCVLIALDAQGGGIGIIEALGDKSKIKRDEVPIFPIVEGHPLHDGKKRIEDDWAGSHMVEMVQFANATYTSEANHGLRKDLEDKALLFPYCDPAILAVACHEDLALGRLYDTQEDAVMEIEDLKEELGTITHSQTPGSLRDHWDTPEIKLAGSKKGRMRKDRYSSLLMANYAARRITRTVETPPLMPYGGFVQHLTFGEDDNGGKPDLGHGPDWWTKGVEGNFDDYGCV